MVAVVRVALAISTPIGVGLVFGILPNDVVAPAVTGGGCAGSSTRKSAVRPVGSSIRKSASGTLSVRSSGLMPKSINSAVSGELKKDMPID